MFYTSDETTISSQIKSFVFYLFSIILTSIIISLGLVTSTQVSGYHLRNVYFPVDKASCTCDCWDGFYRGLHSRGGYKVFYFNYETSMVVILTVVLFYSELFRRVLLDFFLKKSCLFILFIPSIYSNFYGAWSIINYLNDFDHDRMLKSQIYFSLTEFIASYLFYQCLMKKNRFELSNSLIYSLFTISFLHLILASGELNIERFGRNLSLVLSDFISLCWIVILLIKYEKFRPNKLLICKWLFVTILLWLFYHIFCPFIEKTT